MGHFCLLVGVSSPRLQLLTWTNASERQTGLTLSLGRKIVQGNSAGARRWLTMEHACSETYIQHEV